MNINSYKKLSAIILGMIMASLLIGCAASSVLEIPTMPIDLRGKGQALPLGTLIKQERTISLTTSIFRKVRGGNFVGGVESMELRGKLSSQMMVNVMPCDPPKLVMEITRATGRLIAKKNENGKNETNKINHPLSKLALLKLAYVKGGSMRYDSAGDPLSVRNDSVNLSVSDEFLKRFLHCELFPSNPVLAGHQWKLEPESLPSLFAVGLIEGLFTAASIPRRYEIEEIIDAGGEHSLFMKFVGIRQYENQRCAEIHFKWTLCADMEGEKIDLTMDGTFLRSLKNYSNLEHAITLKLEASGRNYGKISCVYRDSNRNLLISPSPIAAHLKWVSNANKAASPWANNEGKGCVPALGRNGMVYFCTGSLFALDSKTGRKIWEFGKGGISNLNMESAPVIGADGTVYVGSNGSDKRLFAIKGDTGKIKWIFHAGNRIVSSPAIGIDGTVYFGTETGEPEGPKLYALDGKTGVKKWEIETGGCVKVPIVVGADGTVYVKSDEMLLAVDHKNSTRKWGFEVHGTGSPVIDADGMVLIIGKNGKLYALNGNTGIKKWEFGAEKTKKNVNGVTSCPAIGVDGTVYFGASGHIFALNGENGTMKWKSGIAVGVHGNSPAIGANGTVYVAASDDKLYALNGKTGAKKWEFKQFKIGAFDSPIIGPDGTLYVGGWHGDFLAFKTTSKGPAKSPWPMRGQNAQRTGQAPKN